ncbi:hypothetical protein DFH11DRAFT_71473 [Phellopilus nigrolimitatus]|nr:hypothetical protein DFH11DRAFT_71473 [Phellopilus nigrolimitatus]
MLIKNLVQGSLVNGSLGKVVAFKTVAEARKDMTDIAKVDTAQDAKNKAKEMLDEKSMNKISEHLGGGRG